MFKCAANRGQSETVPSLKKLCTFYAQRTYVVKVIAIYMRIHTEKSADNRAHCVAEVSGEGDACVQVRNDQRRLDSLEQIGSEPILLGKTFSSSRMPWVQFISASTYSGAGSLVGLLYLAPSSQRYSYLQESSVNHARQVVLKTHRGPADMIGHWFMVSMSVLCHHARRTITDLLWCAELGDGPIQHIQMIEEVDGFR